MPGEEKRGKGREIIDMITGIDIVDEVADDKDLLQQRMAKRKTPAGISGGTVRRKKREGEGRGKGGSNGSDYRLRLMLHSRVLL